MSAFTRRVASLLAVPEGKLERLSGGDLSEVLVLRRPDGRCTVAKGGTATGIEATMLRVIAGSGVPAPHVEGEYAGVLLLEYVPNDGVFSPHSWADVGAGIARLHARTGDRFGWSSDYALGTVGLDNRESDDWPTFWGEQRLVAASSVLDRPWRQRVEGLAARMTDLLPQRPVPALLHGDLWSGNILVREGRLAALIDPACYYGDREVDLAMLSLFTAPPEEFWDAYGAVEPGWEERRTLYQLFPALVHLRLFGRSYATMVDRLLGSLGA